MAKAKPKVRNLVTDSLTDNTFGTSWTTNIAAPTQATYYSATTLSNT